MPWSLKNVLKNVSKGVSFTVTKGKHLHHNDSNRYQIKTTSTVCSGQRVQNNYLNKTKTGLLGLYCRCPFISALTVQRMCWSCWKPTIWTALKTVFQFLGHIRDKRESGVRWGVGCGVWVCGCVGVGGYKHEHFNKCTKIKTNIFIIMQVDHTSECATVHNHGNGVLIHGLYSYFILCKLRPLADGPFWQTTFLNELS